LRINGKVPALTKYSHWWIRIVADDDAPTPESAIGDDAADEYEVGSLALNGLSYSTWDASWWDALDAAICYADARNAAKSELIVVSAAKVDAIACATTPYETSEFASQLLAIIDAKKAVLAGS
jgi:hypothetical protein